MNICQLALAGIFLTSMVTSLRAQAPAKDSEFFTQNIQPLLREYCLKCHSAEKHKGDIDLESFSSVDQVKKNPKLWLTVAEQLGHNEMPPKEKPQPTAAQRAQLLEWATHQGRPAAAKAIDWDHARTYWAFQPPLIQPRPKIKDAHWPKRELDYFIRAAQEKQGLKPGPAAARSTWIRRATFDLIGLPPTLEEIDAFERDTQPDAFARVIDRLLASPHYGERWGRFWLDLARYADDEGVSFLTPSPNAYLYRDWVIQALNRDLPYDQFIRLQLAGDEITEPTNDWFERLGGLGFQGLGPQFRKGAAGEAKAKADELEDRIDTLSRGVLGVTISCARCHDHKFDPIPTRDYYSLAAAYNGAAWSPRLFASPEAIAALKKWEAELAERKARLKQFAASESQRLGSIELTRVDAYLISAWKLQVLKSRGQPADPIAAAQREKLTPHFLNQWIQLLAGGKAPAPLKEWLVIADPSAKSAVVKDGAVEVPVALLAQTEKLKATVAAARLEEEHRKSQPDKKATPASAVIQELLTNPGVPFGAGEKEAVALLSGEPQKQYRQLLQALEQFEKMAPPTPLQSPSVSGGGQPMNVFVRGNPEKLGEPAPPGFLKILSERTATKVETRNQFSRLDLANAIVNPKNPLTARVIVNRVWHYHFGRGIVASLGNFGHLGDRPTHPALLDTLSVRFMESGWSLKWLHREIMLSATYRLGGVMETRNLAADPDNHLLWRMTPRRLDLEAWRDGMLAVAGRLDPRLGGPSLDPKNPGVKQDGLPGYSSMIGPHADDPAQGRRTVYCIISRYAPNPTMGLFDFPEPNVASDRRTVTTIPQQQLFVLNSQFVHTMAKGLAARIEQPATSEEDRLRLAWRLAYGRLPDARETKLALLFLRSAGDGGTGQLTVWEQFCHSLLASNEFTFIN